jgi:hypothetical protein
LNSHPYPELGRFDYIVVAGVVEYVKNATMFFSGLRKYGDVIVMTFLSSQSKVKGRNLRTLEEINKCISRAGWEVVIKEDYTDSHRLMILRKIYAKKTVVLGE